MRCHKVRLTKGRYRLRIPKEVVEQVGVREDIFRVEIEVRDDSFSP